MVTILYGLYWCLPMKSHPDLGHQEISQFCYDSCLNSKYCINKRWSLYHVTRMWPHYHIATMWPFYRLAKMRPFHHIIRKCSFCHVTKKWPLYHLENDLHFLLMSLFATDAGLGKVFKSVQIAHDISQELSAHLESLDNFDSMKHPQKAGRGD